MATFREDPYPDFNFRVEVEGVGDDGLLSAFSEVSGLGVSIEPVEYRTGGEDTTVRKLPGLRRYSNVVLKRGIIGDLAFWQWLKTVQDGQVERRTVVITLLDESREPVLRWQLRRAWPCKYEGPSLNAATSEVALETLEICHEGLELE